MPKILKHTVVALCGLSILALHGPAIGQRQRTLCDEMVNSVAEWCSNNWNVVGYSSGAECFNSEYSMYCPEQAGSPDAVGERDWTVFWMPICKDTWAYWACT